MGCFSITLSCQLVFGLNDRLLSDCLFQETLNQVDDAFVNIIQTGLH